MLTRVTVRNFKRFGLVEIELGNPVVFIGPNDSGKTTALQALALWDMGVKRWSEKRKGKLTPEKRPGVTINRRDLIAIPVPDTILLWRNLKVRDASLEDGKQETHNIRIDIIVEGVSRGKQWKCGVEFDYANDESFYCRPLRLSEDKNPKRMSVPPEVADIHVAFLPPMSGLAAREDRLDPGSINVRLGEGRTAEVIRNLCYRIVQSNDGKAQWQRLYERMESLFGVQLMEPSYIAERGEISMSYKDLHGNRLDLASSGRGMQQTLLLLSYLAINRNAILLLDEPDAHLEILRQRQIYQVLSDAALEQDNQIVAASHSEIILNEAAGRDVVVAFLGKPHRIDDRGSQLLKALKDIGYDQYYQAEELGWVLYIEGSTDLAILRAFAKLLGHAAQRYLERPFVCYVENKYQRMCEHFYGLREAKKDLVAFALYDQSEKQLEEREGIVLHVWKKREIENYLCQEETLLRWAAVEGKKVGDLFAVSWRETMKETINEVEKALNTLGKSAWSPETKVSGEFLEPLLGAFYKKLNLPNLMSKARYHLLAYNVPTTELDSEIGVVLDKIVGTARQAKPIAS